MAAQPWRAHFRIGEEVGADHRSDGSRRRHQGHTACERDGIRSVNQAASQAAEFSCPRTPVPPPLLYLILSGGENSRLAASTRIHLLRLRFVAAASGFSSLLFVVLERTLMPASGELIRMMNFVDDIAATLRRVSVSIHLLSEEEKKRLAEYMRQSDPNFVSILGQLEQGA